MTKDKYLFICERNASKLVGLFAEQIEIEVMFFMAGLDMAGSIVGKRPKIIAQHEKLLKFIRKTEFHKKSKT